MRCFLLNEQGNVPIQQLIVTSIRVRHSQKAYKVKHMLHLSMQVLYQEE